MMRRQRREPYRTWKLGNDGVGWEKLCITITVTTATTATSLTATRHTATSRTATVLTAITVIILIVITSTMPITGIILAPQVSRQRPLLQPL